MFKLHSCETSALSRDLSVSVFIHNFTPRDLRNMRLNTRDKILT